MAVEKPDYEKALDERDEFDYQAYCLLKRLIRCMDYNPGRQQVIAVINEFGGEDGSDLFQEAEEIIDGRENANQRFGEGLIIASRANREANLPASQK